MHTMIFFFLYLTQTAKHRANFHIWPDLGGLCLLPKREMFIEEQTLMVCLGGV